MREKNNTERKTHFNKVPGSKKKKKATFFGEDKILKKTNKKTKMTTLRPWRVFNLKCVVYFLALFSLCVEVFVSGIFLFEGK
jgi:hypothetical protein